MHKLFALLLMLLMSFPAGAVLVDGPQEATTSLESGPLYWGRVGQRGVGSGVYLGKGWVITAAHVGAGDFVLEGVTYPWVVDSDVQIQNDDETPTDLLLFQIQGAPELPDFPVIGISEATPPDNSVMLMIGEGRDRGEPTIWNPQGQQIAGWEWAETRVKRWGVNLLGGAGLDIPVGDTNTISLWTDFSQDGDPFDTNLEGQATSGDSGGAFYVPANPEFSVWNLTGIMIARKPFLFQPGETALHGNLTYAADLSVYRDQILSIVAPQCSDGLDNDGDGLTDYPEDITCSRAEDDSEFSPAIDVTMQFHDFGAVEVGHPGVILFVVRNSGTEELTITEFDFDATNDGSFWMPPSVLPRTLAPGAMTLHFALFVPMTTGVHSTNLRIVSDDPNQAVLETPLTGRGVLGEMACADVTFMDLTHTERQPNNPDSWDSVAGIAGSFDLGPDLSWDPADPGISVRINGAPIIEIGPEDVLPDAELEPGVWRLTKPGTWVDLDLNTNSWVVVFWFDLVEELFDITSADIELVIGHRHADILVELPQTVNHPRQQRYQFVSNQAPMCGSVGGFFGNQ